MKWKRKKEKMEKKKTNEIEKKRNGTMKNTKR